MISCITNGIDWQRGGDLLQTYLKGLKRKSVMGEFRSTVNDTYMSTQPCSPIMSMALTCCPADRYISAAARGSLLL